MKYQAVRIGGEIRINAVSDDGHECHHLGKLRPGVYSDPPADADRVHVKTADRVARELTLGPVALDYMVQMLDLLMEAAAVNYDGSKMEHSLEDLFEDDQIAVQVPVGMAKAMQALLKKLDQPVERQPLVRTGPGGDFVEEF